MVPSVVEHLLALVDSPRVTAVAADGMPPTQVVVVVAATAVDTVGALLAVEQALAAWWRAMVSGVTANISLVHTTPAFRRSFSAKTLAR